MQEMKLETAMNYYNQLVVIAAKAEEMTKTEGWKDLYTNLMVDLKVCRAALESETKARNVAALQAKISAIRGIIDTVKSCATEAMAIVEKQPIAAAGKPRIHWNGDEGTIEVIQ